MDAGRTTSADSRVGGNGGGAPVGRGCPELQLDVLREMLSTMATLTESGQRYSMAKIVAFIRGRMSSRVLVLSKEDEAAISTLLDFLGGEATGFVADAELFVPHGHTLVDLLEASALPRPAARRPQRSRYLDQRIPAALAPS